MTLIDKNTSRRTFLRMGLQTAGSMAGLSALGGWQKAMASVDTTGYKALVCVFLYGGNDGFNVIVPSSGNAYSTYSTSRRNLALAQNSLLPITPNVSDGNTYGLHPNLPELQTLFQNGRLAFVANVGTLVRPTTPTQYKAGSVPLPPNLFSHADQTQTWMTSVPGQVMPYGWGGKIADMLASQGYGNPQLATNITLNGDNNWQAGSSTAFYTMGPSGAPVLIDYQYPTIRGGARKAAFDNLLSIATNSSDPNLDLHEYARIENRTITSSQYVNSGMSSASPLKTTFPGTPIGMQFQLAAQLINARSTFGLSRQMFFIGLDGFDVHTDAMNSHAALLSQLSPAIGAFYNATVEMGVQNSVTGFTMSDFGRTLTSNGSGSDHGWGNHHVVFGGAVKGKSIYGTMPDLTVGGANDSDAGRIVPTLATDQYAATLARWFGVADADLNSLFPNLPNFSTRNIGFV